MEKVNSLLIKVLCIICIIFCSFILSNKNVGNNPKIEKKEEIVIAGKNIQGEKASKVSGVSLVINK